LANPLEWSIVFIVFKTEAEEIDRKPHLEKTRGNLRKEGEASTTEALRSWWPAKCREYRTVVETF
jgi:hypothetical protein